MDALQFAYWLQGYAELTSEAPTPEQWASIKEHLATVFKKVTPPAPGDVLKKIGDQHRLPNINPGVLPWPQQVPNTGTPFGKPWTIECGVAGGVAPQTYC